MVSDIIISHIKVINLVKCLANMDQGLSKKILDAHE